MLSTNNWLDEPLAVVYVCGTLMSAISLKSSGYYYVGAFEIRSP
jgi:hypothetical protein